MAKLEDATRIVNESLATQTFVAYLSEQFTEACTNFEMVAYETRIDTNLLLSKEQDKEQLIGDWYAIDDSGPEGETLDEFRERIDGLFKAAAPATEESQILIVPYPVDCDLYLNTIEASL